jgi:hypothetical protein
VLVQLSSTFESSAERVWAEVQTSRLLLHVAAPLVVFTPAGGTPLPATWSPGRYRVWMWLFGLLPMGRQWVGIETVDLPPGHHGIRDNGTGDLVRVWDHLITIAPLGERQCRYTDRVEVKAGVLTPFFWAFARIFYAHRQRRWHALIARDFHYPA